MPQKLAIICPIRILQESLCSVLQSRPEFAFVKGVACSAEFVEAFAGNYPDVVLLDHSSRDAMTVMDSLSPIGQAITAVVFGVRGLAETLTGAAPIGPVVYLPDFASFGDLIAAAQITTSLTIDGLIQQRYVGKLHSHGRYTGALTVREEQVLAILALGLSNKEIGARLNVAESTVKNHVHHLLQKLGTANRLRAAAMARSLWYDTTLSGWGGTVGRWTPLSLTTEVTKTGS